MIIHKKYGIFRIKNNQIEGYCQYPTIWSKEFVYFFRNISVNFYKQKFQKSKNKEIKKLYEEYYCGIENYLKRVNFIHKELKRIQKNNPEYDVFLLKIGSNKPIKLKNGQYIQILWKVRQLKLHCHDTKYTNFVDFKKLEEN